MSSPKVIITDDKKMGKSVPINITSKSVPLDSDLLKSPPKVQTTLYKTERCRSWITTGMCKYGNKCQFAHGDDELRPVMRHPKYKTQICKTFSRDGFCPYSSRCRFIHPGEIDSKSPPQDYMFEDEMNSAPIERSMMGLSLSPSPISMMNNPLLNERTSPMEGGKHGFNANGKGSNSSTNPLFSSSLPNFTDNWLSSKNLSWNNNNNVSPTKNSNGSLNNSKDFSTENQEDFYDPFNMSDSSLSAPKSKKSDSSLFSKAFLPSSSPGSQFPFSPPPNHVFNLSNPNIMSPTQLFSFEEEDSSSIKKRTKSIPELYNAGSSPLSPTPTHFPGGFPKSKPTAIPIGVSNSPKESKSPSSTPNNTANSNPNNSGGGSDSKSRLPFFTSLAN